MSFDGFCSDAFNRLPLDIQNMLKRKSSRDPASRFTAKLHTLLTFVTENPHMESEIGLGWISNEVFKMNKHSLVTVMGIKPNTLNVNLRDCQFKQQQHNKDGWTQWSKEGFTKDSSDVSQEMTTKIGFTDVRLHGMKTFGKMNSSDIATFQGIVKSIWRSLNNNMDVLSANADVFLQRAAERFRVNGQTMENARDVLKAIIYPDDTMNISFEMFEKFMAMFGPETSSMMKIQSLLQYSGATGNWMVFSQPTAWPRGYFMDEEPNCLIVDNGRGQIIKAWNMPLIGWDNTYVVDDSNRSYQSWGAFFEAHPVYNM